MRIGRDNFAILDKSRNGEAIKPDKQINHPLEGPLLGFGEQEILHIL